MSLLICFPFGAASAAKIHPRAGNTSAAFLKLDPSPRATALGGAFSAVADDAYAVHWNPAGLSQLRRSEATLMYNRYFGGMRQQFAALAHPVSDRWALGFHYGGLAYKKDLERRTGTGEESDAAALTASEGDFGALDAAGGISAARRLGRRFSLGAGLNLFQQKIDNLRATSFSMDAGFLWRSPEGAFALGGGARHLGPSVRFLQKSYPLPSTYHLGAASRLFKDRLLVSAGLERPNDNYLFTSFGVEFSPLSFVTLRSGYRYRLNGNELDALSGFRAGLGVGLAPFRLDYAFAPLGDLENETHRVALSARFGPKREEGPVAAPAAAAPPARADWVEVPARVARRISLKTTVKTLRINAQGTVSEILGTAEEDSAVLRIVFRSNDASAASASLALEETQSETPGWKTYREYTLLRNVDASGPVGVAFRLPKAWLAEQGVAPGEAALAAWDGAAWKRLTTRLIAETSEAYEFRADAEASDRWIVGGPTGQ